MSFAPIIEEAWEHRRHRHQIVAAAALALAVTAGIVIALTSPGSGSRSGGAAPARTMTVAASTVLSKTPYMGVSCPIANSIACDRVGLAVWLRHPAVSVTATIAGARLPLNDYGAFRYRGRKPRTAFDGFLQPAGIVSRLHVHPVEGSAVYTRHGHLHVAMRHHMWFGDSSDYPPPVPVRLTIHEPGGRTLVTRTHVELSAGWG